MTSNTEEFDNSIQTRPSIPEVDVLNQINDLIAKCGGNAETFEGQLISQLIQTSLKLMQEGHDTGQLKLITRSLKEMRYAYRVFNRYPANRRISIFGSARTPEDHPDYLAAKEFSAGMAQHGWMCITGAANGIMKAGLEGPKKESTFGLSIRLPFESKANSVIDGDPKLIIFRYFFTRKLMFISHSEAVAAFPGGFGTLDELFEVLTLMQTGKANIIPVVLLEGVNGTFWKEWEKYIQQQMLARGWISPQDAYMYFIAPSIDEGILHIEKFYRRYHSSRYVKDTLVIRLKSDITDEDVAILNQKFSKLLSSGQFERSPALPEEKEFPELPRLIFQHTRRDFGLIRALIDQINDFE